MSNEELVYGQMQPASADSQNPLSTVSGLPDDGADSASTDLDTAPPAASSKTPHFARDVPKSFGQYRVVGLLGQGAFGVIYRGRDTDLHRDVAIKVPRPERLASSGDAETFLAEARVLASLKHPGIVPVYCFGRTDDGLCYVVSQFVAGGDLASLVRRKRLSHRESAELLACVAEALGHAHQHGMVHRDVKPANILIDDRGLPLVADFGLALTDDAYGESAGLYGTPAYMSPEQARGEGHRVDARSDIYSLGVVLYELLAGRRPYRRKETPELLDEIAGGEIRPPRIFDHTIAIELERICLKALARRAADRYTSAFDMAEDLRQYLAAGQSRQPSLPSVLGDPSAQTVQAKVVPKGLRSFDAGDADFFLELLPGPTDREGLPDSIRFWKTRIERNDAGQTFAVGVLYGPSGCGKSSLVKAGLLPRLASRVRLAYVEATSDNTEARLLEGLQKATRHNKAATSLTDAIVELRGGQGLAGGEKLLIVLDQFEQWLHAHPDPQSSELVRALRQCDGGRVQCLLLVRADFWPGVSRFMRELEIPLVEGHNCALADLFDASHARRVLALFGRAYDRLPSSAAPAADNEVFLDQAAAALAEDGQVIPVRLALFAEMVRRKSWTPGTLSAIGGIAGVGVAFLEDTFSASTAPPPHRMHQAAARGVLKSLLPEAGSDIKGHRRSRKELLAASGYSRPAEFAELMRILDGELRLVTPADDDHPEFETQNPESYQLTHDYLVPSLRDWLTSKQRETRRGRAELCLAERSAAYNARPDSRNLPGWWEWARILLFTRAKKRTPAEKRVMRAAAYRYVSTFAVLAAVLVTASLHELTLFREKEERRKTEQRDSLLRLNNSQLGVLELTSDFWTDVHDTLDRLATLDPQEELRRRRQFETRFARELAAEIKKVVRERPGDRDRWSKLVGKLGQRDKQLAAQPKAALDDFLMASQVVLDLRAPFRELPAFLQQRVLIAPDRGGLSLNQTENASISLPYDTQYYFDIEMTVAAVDWNDARMGFHVVADAPEHPALYSVEVVKRKNGSWALGVSRAGAPVRMRELPALQDEITLSVKRTLGQFEVALSNADNISLLTYRDVYALGAGQATKLAVAWPEQALLTSLRVWQPSSRPVTPIVEGDGLYNRGDHAAAQRCYEQALKSDDGPEAQYKIAWCQYHSGNRDEAISAFARLAGARHPLWTMLAACDCAALCVSEEDLQQTEAALGLLEHEPLQGAAADLVFDRLGILVRLYPGDMGNDIPKQVKLKRHVVKSIGSIARRVAEHCARDFPWQSMYSVEWRIALAYAAVGDDDLAAPILESWIASRAAVFAAPMTDEEFQSDAMKAEMGVFSRLIQEYVALLLRKGDLTTAAELIARLRAATSAPTILTVLRMENARVLANQGDLATARTELDEVARLAIDDSRLAPDVAADAMLLRGFVAAPDEDARQIWAGGFDRLKPREPAPDDQPVYVIGSLCGRFTDDDVKALIGAVAGKFANRFPLANVVTSQLAGLPELVYALKHTWAGQRGREFARQMAFGTISFHDRFLIQIPLSVYQTMSAGAFQSSPSPDQEQVLWDTVMMTLKAYEDGTLTLKDMTKLFFAWKGLFDGDLGWQGVAPALEGNKLLRASLAYMASCHMRHLNHPSPAKRFLSAAADDAPADSVLARLVAEQQALSAAPAAQDGR